MFVLQVSLQINTDLWYPSNGCSARMTNDVTMFTELEESNQEKVTFGDKKNERITEARKVSKRRIGKVGKGSSFPTLRVLLT